MDCLNRFAMLELDELSGAFASGIRRNYTARSAAFSASFKLPAGFL